MTGVFKALAVAVALGSASAPAAMGQEFHSGSESGTTYLTLELQIMNSIDTTAGNISCTSVGNEGQYSGTTTSEITFTNIAFSGCTAFGLTAHIDAMGCDYRIAGSGPTSGTFNIECPETGGGVQDAMTITPTQGGAAICHISIPGQDLAAEMENTGEVPEGMDVGPTEEPELEYSVERTAGGSKCPTNGPHTDGVYTGTTTVTGFTDAGHANSVSAIYGPQPTRKFHSGAESGTTYLTLDQQGESQIETSAGPIECNGFSTEGQYSGTTTSELTFTNLSYSECTAFGLAAHIDAMGCDYKVAGSGPATESFSIDCPETGGGAKDELTVTPTEGGAPICHIRIPDQALVVKINNTASAGEVPGDTDIGLAGSPALEYTVERTAGGSKCPTEGSHTDGKYEGSTTVTGYADEAHASPVVLTYDSPTSPKFHSGVGGTTYLTNLGNVTFDTTGSGSINCSASSVESQYSGSTATELTFSDVTYSGCSAYGVSADVDTMGCDYKVAGAGFTSVKLNFECPETGGGVQDEITITPTVGGAAICHISIPGQELATEIENTVSVGKVPEDMDIGSAKAREIKYSVERTVGGAKCPTNGMHTDGKYTSTTTVTAFSDAKHANRVGLTYNSPVPSPPPPPTNLHSGSASGTTYLTLDEHALNSFDTPTGSINCSSLNAQAQYAGTTTSEITFTNVSLAECTGYGLLTHIDMMGCDYKVTLPGPPSGILHIVCPATGGGVTDAITVTPTFSGAPICHIDIPEQTVNVTVINTGATPGGVPDDVDVIPSPGDSITYTVERTAGGSKCPTEGHHDDGIYTSSTTATGFEDAGHTKRVGLTAI